MNFMEILLVTFLVCLPGLESQRTILDDKFGGVYRQFRELSWNFLGRTGQNRNTIRTNENMGKLQKNYARSLGFVCDVKNARSPEKPKSVHKLRPGDIDVIGAMGDSLTAANGALSTNVFQVFVENRGISWSIGGQENWKTFLTLPNILREFNPNLYGYSLRDSFSFERASRFNVAELGSMSRDMPHQAQNLVKRMKSDPRVNMTQDWKLVTLFIGNNDFCSDICYYNNPESIVLKKHEKDLVLALRILRDNIPRLIVNLVPPPNLRVIREFKGKPQICEKTHLFSCPCLFGPRFGPHIDFYTKLMLAWIQLDKEIVYRKEFNREDFTVNYQPFTSMVSFPLADNGLTDFTYLSTDCFHLSQKAHARAANGLWNNMLEPNDKKTHDWGKEFELFMCPTKERPYISTRENS